MASPMLRLALERYENKRSKQLKIDSVEAKTPTGQDDAASEALEQFGEMKLLTRPL